ncbi:MAG: hypothetical protein IPK58_21105 [Acidobacteria bacterium]|nr:hypothetical protein [Acidobacteriota bacterium]
MFRHQNKILEQSAEDEAPARRDRIYQQSLISRVNPFLHRRPRHRGTLNVAAVKAPGIGDRRKAMLEDISVLTGGKVISSKIFFLTDRYTIE